MSANRCTLTSLDKVNDHVYHIRLQPAEPFQFEAGQYLQVVMGEKDKRPFSIASAPGDAQIELHIGATEANPYAMDVVKRLQADGALDAEIGLGQAQLCEDSNRPVLLLAGGTGFSYVQSIALHLAETKPDHKVVLYWGGRHNQSMYADAKMREWADNHNGFEYVPVIQHPDEGWTGKTGYVHQAVMEDIDNLCDYDIYIAGHFDMVKVVRDDFVAEGAVLEHMYADAFAFI